MRRQLPFGYTIKTQYPCGGGMNMAAVAVLFVGPWIFYPALEWVDFLERRN